jgi:hypothetical protein
VQWLACLNTAAGNNNHAAETFTDPLLQQRACLTWPVCNGKCATLAGGKDPISGQLPDNSCVSSSLRQHACLLSLRARMLAAGRLSVLKDITM